MYVAVVDPSDSVKIPENTESCLCAAGGTAQTNSEPRQSGSMKRSKTAAPLEKVQENSATDFDLTQIVVLSQTTFRHLDSTQGRRTDRPLLRVATRAAPLSLNCSVFDCIY